MTQISFTGFKNISAITTHALPPIDFAKIKANEEMDDFEKQMLIDKLIKDNTLTIQSLNLQLKDDFNGKDLTDFNNAAKSSDLKNYRNPINQNFLNINIAQNNKKDIFKIVINDKELKVKDENLKLISFIAKLLTRISKQPKEKLVVNETYLEDKELSGVLINRITRNAMQSPFKTEEDLERGIAALHGYDNVSKVSKDMSDKITEHMIEYFS